MKTHKDILNLIDEIENDDGNIESLEKAMIFFCGNYDICEGFKHALRLTIDEQYTHHATEQDPEDMEKLYKILTTS